MQLFLPKQHGAWAMLIIPFWLGVAASGFQWQHIPFFFGWLFLYLATYPLLLLFKKKKIPFYTKWAVIYFIPAVLLLFIVLITRPSIIYFGLIMIPFFFINAYFSSKNNDRAFLNDVSAILTFSIAGLASSYFYNGSINENTILIFIASILFFTGSTFYVKTMIREKKNQQFKWVSWGYHVIVPMIWAVLGEWVVAIAFIPSLARAIYMYGKPYSAKQVGIYEIVNAAIFFLLIVAAIFL
ncbi:YwiC-like family protein [Bacillus sp. DNRA2]|uniref:YwiC-like family protein n=1 Tax=Bacillus sp. DNRA2 TaxID=2723053 RepID=UPI00145E494B|nr:YwiC-like family protein [Bacillus sp. DNRA2]NMD70815.1 YwiC-like family protein [Bacillus sp. DNRA2]